MEFNLIDIIILLIIGIYAIKGLVKGFILSIANIMSFFLCFILSKSLSPRLTNYIINYTKVGDTVNSYIAKKFQINSLSIANLSKIMGVSKLTEDVLPSIVINMFAFIIIFAASYILLKLIANVLNIASKLPIINQFNHIGGLLIGVIEGVLVVFLVFSLLTIIIPALPTSSPLTKSIDSSIIASSFYRYNFITVLVNGISLK